MRPFTETTGDQPSLTGLFDAWIPQPPSLRQECGARATDGRARSLRSNEHRGEEPVDAIGKSCVEETAEHLTAAFHNHADDAMFGQALKEWLERNALTSESPDLHAARFQA